MPETTAFPASRAVATNARVAPIAVSVSNPGVTVVVATPAPPFAVTLSGEPVRPADVAVIVCIPPAPPSVHAVLASPAAEVLALVGVTDPLTTAKVTFCAATGLSNGSAIRTTIGSASATPGAPLWPPPDCSASVLAARGVIANAVDVSGPTPGATTRSR